ncbi:hypothetical protein FOL47_005956 [Perkinsus chesapeaki]|uniref:Uncharacterized protein n=1 Tax=Perkinsus chesapeaki TaxID=330153 RepID=A0A7J6MZ92_PERCH|nr:hypothetical protein FOL47_005956 [Perkinsus chesapeaki]
MAPKKDHGGGGERIGLLASPADLASRFDETLNRMTPVSSVKKMTIEEEENSNEREMENEAIANSLTARADEMLNHFATTQPPTRRHFSRYSAAVHPSDAIRKTNEAVAARTARRRSIGNLNNEIEDEELGSPINQELIDGVEMVSDIASSPSRSDNITMTPAAAASAAGTPSGQVNIA